jgi:REP element-mobilizing transposase RayT
MQRKRRGSERAWTQLGLSARGTWGGYRAGAGRPRGRTVQDHERRPPLSRHTPVHVTLRLLPDLPTLRRHTMWNVLRERFRAGKDRFGFRLVDFSVQSNHIHLVCEGNDKRALTRGMQGLAIRLARGINKRLGRRGKVFACRYHARQLKSPRETRSALVYVLGNYARHANIPPGYIIDVYSTAPPYFKFSRRFAGEPDEGMTTAASSWLLRTERERLIRDCS